MRLGVIDCGTNTFHLLVVDVDGENGITQVHKERRYVRIGQEGVDKIGKAPFRRGIACLADYKILIESLGVERLKVFGTEALRRASNGQAFISAVEKETGIRIQLISGDEEARFIHLGVMQAVPPFEGKALLMDIGGGSVEFIIASSTEVFWAKSFPIGVQVLFSEFHREDPMPPNRMLEMERYLEEILLPLTEALKTHETPVLIGASGSFEIVENFYFKSLEHHLFSIIPVEEYAKIHAPIVGSSLVERHGMELLPSERAELIVVAFGLIHFIIKKAGIREIITSAYAMKEGVLMEMMREEPITLESGPARFYI